MKVEYGDFKKSEHKNSEYGLFRNIQDFGSFSCSSGSAVDREGVIFHRGGVIFYYREVTTFH